MNNFLVVKILDVRSISLPSTFVYGTVELRSHTSDSSEEVSILKVSAKSHSLDFNSYMYGARVATIVRAADLFEAVSIANDLFSAVLDLKSIEFHMSSLVTSGIGFVKNLETGNTEPLLKREFDASMSFLVSQGDIQKYDWINYIVGLSNELSERYKRSLHWTRRCRHEKDLQIKILFCWFSIEALFKWEDRKNIGGLIRWFLGFPNGVVRRILSKKFLSNLESHEKYDYWRERLIDIIENIRKFRNDSVHSGFRDYDFSKDELQLYSRVMTLAASRCQAAVQSALLNGITTISEFEDYVPIIFEENKNSINDTHNTVLYYLHNSLVL